MLLGTSSVLYRSFPDRTGDPELVHRTGPHQCQHCHEGQDSHSSLKCAHHSTVRPFNMHLYGGLVGREDSSVLDKQENGGQSSNSEGSATFFVRFTRWSWWPPMLLYLCNSTILAQYARNLLGHQRAIGLKRKKYCLGVKHMPFHILKDQKGGFFPKLGYLCWTSWL